MTSSVGAAAPWGPTTPLSTKQSEVDLEKEVPQMAQPLGLITCGYDVLCVGPVFLSQESTPVGVVEPVVALGFPQWVWFDV